MIGKGRLETSISSILSISRRALFGEKVEPSFKRDYKSRYSGNRPDKGVSDPERPNPSSGDGSKTPYISQDLLDMERQSLRPHKTARQQRSSLPKNVAVEEEIVFGVSSIDLALDAGRRTFHRLFLKRTKAEQENLRLSIIESKARRLGIPVQIVDVRTLDFLAEDRPHQGACLDASPLQFETAEALGCDLNCPTLVENSLNRDVKQLWIFLGRIQDPMNMGAVLRSSYYFGVDRILTAKSHGCRLTPIVSKASSGTAEIMKIYQIENAVSFLKSKVHEGWKVVGTASPDALCSLGKGSYRVSDVNTFTWPERSILIIGNEGEGVEAELLHLCTDLVTVPLKERSNLKVLSLNVSVAAGILLYSHFAQSFQR